MVFFTKIAELAEKFARFIQEKFAHISAETLGWMGNIVFHAATVPTLIALMTGLSDKTPPLDIVLLIWFGLALLFVRAALLKNMLNLITIGFGFVVQAVLMAFIFFK